MSKVLIHSVFPGTPTGYGQLSSTLIPLLKKMGHEVVMQASFGIHCHISDYNGTKIYPVKDQRIYGFDNLGHVIRIEKPDIYLSTFDLFVFDEVVMEYMREKNIPICSWLMIDSAPYQSANMRPLKYVDYPIYCTNWSTLQVPKLPELSHHIPYIMPLAVDPMYEVPITKEIGRKRFNDLFETDVKDSFIVAVNSNNSGDALGRKNFPAIMWGWQQFLELHGTENKILYLHTDIKGEMGKGVDIKKTLAYLHYTPDQVATIMFPDQFKYQTGQYTADDLRHIYGASDLYLNPSDSEGFGMPIVESMLCGCPALVTDFGPAKEIVQNCMNPTLHKKYLLHGDPKYVGFQGYRASVQPYTIKEHLSTIYLSPMDAEQKDEMRDNCIKNYGHKFFESRMRDFLSIVESNIRVKKGLL